MIMNNQNKRADKNSLYWPDIQKQLDGRMLERLSGLCMAEFQSVVTQNRLDDEVLTFFATAYLPLAAWIADKHRKRPVVIGINGAQGSGKSTLGKLLTPLLSTGFNKSVMELSIDDLYLSRHRREQLAKDIHPLLITRGVPGTHDASLAEQILCRLKSSALDSPVFIPVFDKATDDLLPEDQWRMIDQPVDIILFEGWCVGARAQYNQDLANPVNQLEAEEDADGIWRQYVNQQLARSYQSLFAQIDHLMMLKVPDMDCVFKWRLLQEQKLAEQCQQQASSRIMSAEQITRFIMHYERITRFILEEMPSRADLVLQLNKQHQIADVHFKQGK